MFEARETCYFFKQKLGALIFCGQRGEFGISFDMGTSWLRDNLRGAALSGQLSQFGGVGGRAVLIDDMVLVLK